MKAKARVGPKGQVVIPKELRDEFKVMPGDEVMFDADEHVITIHPRADPEKIVDEYIGVIKPKTKPPKTIDWDELYYSQFE
ncbi:MAG: AbrB/MazE/SpoVT family DNA-binding domain-containing protein [Candidatus Hadarchaeota archaeon]